MQRVIHIGSITVKMGEIYDLSAGCEASIENMSRAGSKAFK
jgi:hypothetical protein